MGRDHMWLMMHMCHPIYCPGCSNGVESAGHEIDTPPQTPKIEKGDSCTMIRDCTLSKKLELCMQKKLQSPWQVYWEGFWCLTLMWGPLLMP